jgi:hypothetical protein
MNINDPLVVKVNCSNLNLTELPTILPPNTQILNVASNQVIIFDVVKAICDHQFLLNKNIPDKKSCSIARQPALRKIEATYCNGKQHNYNKRNNRKPICEK